MKILHYAVLVLFSIFSSFIMSYISLATMIGPWMGPTLMLISLIISSFLKKITPRSLLLPVIGGSLGGIMATGVSSAFVTYYFLDKEAFIQWILFPKAYIAALAGLILIAALYAFLITGYVQQHLLQDQQLSFPIGKLMYDISESSDSSSKQKLALGFAGSLLYSLSNFFLKASSSVYDGCVRLCSSRTIGCFRFPSLYFDMELLPMFLAIGFIAGSGMTVPLLLGTVIRTLCIDTLHTSYFNYLSSADFILAVCSGLVVSGALFSLIETPKKLWKFFASKTQVSSHKNYEWRSLITWQSVACFSLCLFYFVSYKFSLPSQLYILLFTVLCTYQMVVIAGKIGLAFLGRFATFIMMPGILLFGWTGLQATMIATFVEICGGVATDLLFGSKAAQLAQLDAREVRRFQFLGIVLAAFLAALASWFLVTHFQLGSEQLFAQRAQSRALLIQAGTFDLYALAVGVIVGIILHILRINTMLVLGGLLMSLSMVLPLVAGGLLSRFVKEKERFEPLCSGVYATISLWMIVTALFGRSA